MADTPWKDLVDCDVQDKERLALFRAKLREWKKCLRDEKDPNSIYRQIIGLLWDDNVWHTFNEARRLSILTNAPSTALSGTLIELLDNSFFARQFISIRKLIERHKYEPSKSVYSLHSLLIDTKQNIHLFTRENYVCYDGISYESISGEDWQMEHLRHSRHFTYDLISGKTPMQRQRLDMLNDDFFKKLETRFGTFNDLQTYVNKFVVHASRPENRPDSKRISDKITLEYLDRCYQELFFIAKGIELLLDDFAVCAVPTPQFDQLENWDKPIVTTEDNKKLYEFWRTRSREIGEWSDEATQHYRPAK